MFMTIIELLIYIEFFKILIYTVGYNNIMFSFHNLFSSMTLTNSLLKMRLFVLGLLLIVLEN